MSKMKNRRKMLTSLLSSYSRALDIIIAGLLIIVGIQLFFVGLEDVNILITLASVLLVVYGVKMIIDAVLRSLMGKELEELVRERE